MPVNTPHPEYANYQEKWQRCRDVVAGQSAIHSKGDTYLPRLKDQDATEYAAYLLRTPFYNATGRTVDGLCGMLFRKPPTFKVPDAAKDMMKDVTLSGVPLEVFASDLVNETLVVGRVGIFVDFPDVPPTATAADAKQLNLRPFMKKYCTENIINWKTNVVKNLNVVSMVVLKECASVPIDEYSDKDVVQYRVLDLVDVVDIGVIYRVRVIQLNDKNEEVLISINFPQINGKYLDYVPFFFISTYDMTPDIEEPPLMDLVETNLSHYRTSADYEHGCHFTGLPTPVITGYTPVNENEKMYIGSTAAWILPNANAKATYLEFTGQGLGALEKNLNRKEQYMVVLGARMLEQQTKAIESAGAAAIHRGGEQSSLQAMARILSLAFEKALTTLCNFASITPTDLAFALNTDFFPAQPDSLFITAIIAAWQNGAINYDTLFQKLKHLEIIPFDREKADEIAKMDEHKPIIPAGTKVNQDNNPTAHPTQRQIQTP